MRVGELKYFVVVMLVVGGLTQSSLAGFGSFLKKSADAIDKSVGSVNKALAPSSSKTTETASVDAKAKEAEAAVARAAQNEAAEQQRGAETEAVRAQFEAALQAAKNGGGLVWLYYYQKDQNKPNAYYSNSLFQEWTHRSKIQFLPIEMNDASMFLSDKYNFQYTINEIFIDSDGTLVSKVERFGGDTGVIMGAEMTLLRSQRPTSPLAVSELTGATYSGGWLTDYAQAQAIAKKQNKPILMDFSGSDWCGWCVALDEQILSKKEFTQYADKNYILLSIDAPRKTKLSPKQEIQNESLYAYFNETYGVRGYPSLVVLNANGQFIKKTGGGGFVNKSDGIQQLIQWLE